MRPRFMPVVVLALMVVAVAGGVAVAATVPASPYDTNAECLACHDTALDGAALSKVEFADTVDFSACSKCHWVSPGAPYVFDHGKTLGAPDCRSCHFYMSTAQPWAGQVATPYGNFATSESPGLSASTIHAAHVNGSWPGSSRDCDQYCKSCHGPTGCSMCHTASLEEDGHGQHVASADPLLPEYAPAVYMTAGGAARASTVVSQVNYALTTVTCAASGCHPRASLAVSPVPTCFSCHDSKTGEHGYTAIDHVAADATEGGIACSACHTLDLATAHGDPDAAGASCVTCHPTPRDTFEAWDQTCATGGCHTTASTAPMHADTQTAHQVDAANTLCLDCHTGTELGSIHTGAELATGETSCLVCHTATSVPATRDCTVCHFTFDEHYDEAAHTSTTLGCGGAGCHDVLAGLMTVHEERNAGFGCFGCHSSIRTAVQDAITAGDTSCGACHGAVSGIGGHRDAHNAVPPLRDATTMAPNYSYYTGSVGTAPTGDCAGCHTSNLVDEHLGLNLGGWVFYPRHDASGNPLTCGSCHDQPAGSTVQDAIANGWSACEGCHTIHGPMQAVHNSAFVDSPEVPCADCHSANLTVEHNGGYTSSAGLTGCDVCHELYAGEFGATVQAAISTGNDTRCSACHTSYHTDSVAHDASSTASLACGSCHAVGQSVIDVSLTALHPTCATCHKSARIGDVSTHTAECASCHSAEGTDYHKAMDASHEYYDMGASCQSCHASTLPEEHEAYLGRYPAYDTTCALCHKNPAFDVTTKTAACSSCHEIHSDIPVLHTAVASDSCVDCHGSADLRVLHGDTMDASCVTCHNATFDLTGKTAECTTCHNATVSPFHGEMDGSHTFATMDAGCQQAGCHTKTLPDEHAKYLSRYPQYADTCALCHLNATLDLTGKTADCSTCHVIHGDIAVAHTATASQACVACHEYTDVRALHGTSPDASCSVCHNAPAGRIDWATATVECTSCHGALSPADPNHYPVAAHAATTETGCVQCHSVDMKTEHFKATVAVTCVACHELKVDAFTAPWDKTCTACHPTKHANQAIAHKSTSTSCTGTGCHVVTDVSVLHGTNCAACHAAGVTASTNCTLCHPGSNPHHVTITLKATTDSGWRTMCGSCHGRTHSMSGCSRCHSASKLHSESRHVDQNSRCAGCHKVATVDTSKNCLACHADVRSGSDGGSWGGWDGGSWGGWGR